MLNEIDDLLEYLIRREEALEEELEAYFRHLRLGENSQSEPREEPK